MSRCNRKSVGGMCVPLEKSAFQACNFLQASDKTTLRTILRTRLAFRSKDLLPSPYRQFNIILVEG